MYMAYTCQKKPQKKKIFNCFLPQHMMQREEKGEQELGGRKRHIVGYLWSYFSNLLFYLNFQLPLNIKNKFYVSNFSNNYILG